MSLIRLYFILLCVIFLTSSGYAQNDTLVEMDSLISFQHFKICKSSADSYYYIPHAKESTNPLLSTKNTSPTFKPKTSILKVTGNILYDVNYRSRIDTPYAENDVYQHMVQTRLDFVYKNRLPFRIYLTARFSNSSLFRNYNDLNFNFNQNEFRRLIKARVFESITSTLHARNRLTDSLKRIIDQLRSKISEISKPETDDVNAQRIVEERERLYFENKKRVEEYSVGKVSDSTAFTIRPELSSKFQNRFLDSLYRNDLRKKSLTQDLQISAPEISDSLKQKKAEVDSLFRMMELAENLYRKSKSGVEGKLSDLRRIIDSTTNPDLIKRKLAELDIPDTVLPKGFKAIWALQSVNLGRSTADYSELSAKNISITGIQIEYNPHYYYAFAAGKVDYRFRDFIVPAQTRTRQYLALARFGKGMRNGNHIFFTYYTGRRQFFNASVASQQGALIPEYNLAGFTVEGVYNVNRNIVFTGEIAKSTTPYYSLDSLKSTNWMNAVTDFSIRSNEAYAGRVNALFPKMNTRISGVIRYTGANFQSFSTFTSGASQLRWKGKVEQSFLKKQLLLIGSIEQNDYVNPFVTIAYKSASKIASIQANLRVKKWPVLSVGYYPSFQLVKTGNEQFQENRFYTFSASGAHFYKFRDTQLSTYIVYSRFYNDSKDSGFVYYNSKNVLVTQNIDFGKYSMMMSGSLNTGPDYQIHSIEGSSQLQLNKWFSFGAGLKVMRHSLVNSSNVGYNGSIILKIPKIGDFQFVMDKGFIPGLNRQLVENKFGRVTYFKTF